METVTDEALAMIENRLNHRPRKRLGFKTHHEVFHSSLIVLHFFLLSANLTISVQPNGKHFWNYRIGNPIWQFRQ
jgi:hypothetical protein